jgi:hypothetical protein
MSKLLSFDAFWEIANPAKHGQNGLYYHPCCDSWTTRNSKSKRLTHSKHLKWRQISSSFDKSMLDKKQALHSRMVENGWRIPVVLNQPCQTQSVAARRSELPFKLYNPRSDIPNLQTNISAKPIPFQALDSARNLDPGNLHSLQTMIFQLLLLLLAKNRGHRPSRARNLLTILSKILLKTLNLCLTYFDNLSASISSTL